MLLPLQTTTPGHEKVQQLTNLNDEQKQQIAEMTKPSDMDPAERKRQYSALRRAIYRDATPALVAKFSIAKDGERFPSAIYVHVISGSSVVGFH